MSTFAKEGMQQKKKDKLSPCRIFKIPNHVESDLDGKTSLKVMIERERLQKEA